MSGTKHDPARLERHLRLVASNGETRSLASRSDDDAAQRRFAFDCECGDEECHEHIWLSLSLYDDLKRNDVPLLADGHPISLARRARSTARQLQEEARALRAQADIQVSRAHRLSSGALLTVHLRSPAEAADLAGHLDDPAEVVDRAGGTDVEVEITATAGRALSQIRDWARGHGNRAVGVTFFGKHRTLDD